MAFISKKKHNDFCNIVNNMISTFENSIATSKSDHEGLRLLKTDVEILEILHKNYCGRLDEMRELMKYYDITEKRIKAGLKHQKSNLKSNISIKKANEKAS